MRNLREIKDEEYYSEINIFKGKKLLLSDNRKLRLLKTKKENRRQILVGMELQADTIETSTQRAAKMAEIINKKVAGSALPFHLDRQNHDSLVKKPRTSLHPFEVRTVARTEVLSASLKKHYQSQRFLDRAIKQVRESGHQSQIQTAREKQKNSQARNPFFKSFKARTHLKSKLKTDRESTCLSYRIKRSCSSALDERTTTGSHPRNTMVLKSIRGRLLSSRLMQ